MDKPTGATHDINTNFTTVCKGLTLRQQQAIKAILLTNRTLLESGVVFEGNVYTGFGDETIASTTTLGGGKSNEKALARITKLLDVSDPDFSLMVACGWTFPGMKRQEAEMLMRKYHRYADIPGSLCNVLYTLESRRGVYQATAAMHKTPVSRDRRIFTPTKQWEVAKSNTPSVLMMMKQLKSQGVL